jgi:hypothetical protein
LSYDTTGKDDLVRHDQRPGRARSYAYELATRRDLQHRYREH